MNGLENFLPMTPMLTGKHYLLVQRQFFDSLIGRRVLIATNAGMMIQSKSYLRTFMITMCFVQLVILTSCLSVGDQQIMSTFPPEYTPIVMVSEGTTLPSKSTLVSIEDLVMQPQKYADQFIEVHGFNEGGLGIPACSPYFRPPIDWVLSAGPYIHYPGGEAGYEPPTIEIKNSFNGLALEPMSQYGLEKQAVVWGWWRLYDGPIGCGGFDSLGTPIPPTQSIQSWYVDAVKFQWLESNAVPTP